MVNLSELEVAFTRGFGAKPRAHQIHAVKELLGLLLWGSGPTTALVQHAPGAGKTETILLLAFLAFEKGLVDRVIILNFATDLEEQFHRRALRFWRALGAQFSVHRAETGGDLTELLDCRGVLFSLLQKFISCPLRLSDRDACRSLVIIDEAHRGIPEEGTFIQNVDAAVGRAAKMLFTATPKRDTLQRYGTLRCDAAADGDLLFRAPFHTYTQRDAIISGAVLNPLEKYVSAIPDVPIDGTKLCDTAMASIPEFVERLHMRRGSQSLRCSWARHILAQLKRIDDDMPEMVRQGHQPKKMVVLGEMQEVFDMAVELRKQVRQRGLKNAFGKRVKVGCFFSGRVDGARSDQEANASEFNSFDDESVLAEADVVVVCRKYTTGWDEWRLVAVFILRRLGSEELLQQLLGRATRSRPGSGKRHPWIFDYLNDPDWVFSAMARFYEECRAYQGVAESELWDLKRQIERFLPEAQRLLDVEGALKLPNADRALLRAAVVRYLGAASAHRGGPLDRCCLQKLLGALNVSMREHLFGGNFCLAERSAAALLYAGNTVTKAVAGTARQSFKPDGIPGALQLLRKALGVRARARACGRASLTAYACNDTDTPVKRVLPVPSPDCTEESPPKQARTNGEGRLPTVEQSNNLDPLLEWTESKESSDVQSVPQCLVDGASCTSSADSEVASTLRKAVDTLVEAFEHSLRRSSPPGQAQRDERHLYLADLHFAAAPLEQSGFQQREKVAVAAKELQQRLDSSFSDYLQPWLEAEARQREAQFERDAKNRGDDFAADVTAAKASYSNCVDKLGGHAGRKFKLAFARNLGRIVASRLNIDRQELMRQRTLHWAGFDQRIKALLNNSSKAGNRQPPQMSCFDEEIVEALKRFAPVADEHGGHQGVCFKKSFEASLRRHASDICKGSQC